MMEEYTPLVQLGMTLDFDTPLVHFSRSFYPSPLVLVLWSRSIGLGSLIPVL